MSIQSAHAPLLVYVYDLSDLHDSTELGRCGKRRRGTLPLILGLARGRKQSTPESQRFVTGRRHHRTSIGTDRRVQNARRVALELLDLGHGGILPKTQLIAGESMA